MKIKCIVLFSIITLWHMAINNAFAQEQRIVKMADLQNMLSGSPNEAFDISIRLRFGIQAIDLGENDEIVAANEESYAQSGNEILIDRKKNKLVFNIVNDTYYEHIKKELDTKGLYKFDG